MPSSLSHVVVFTDDLDAVVRFVTDVAGVRNVTRYETKPETVHEMFGWPVDHGPARCAFVGSPPGGLDLVEIPEGLRGEVSPGVRLLAVANRDAAAAGEAATAAGFDVRGPFQAIDANGAPMAMVEIGVGGVSFELVQFG